MKLKTKIASLTLSALMVSSTMSFAGNEDRAGSAGASELLVNPWARSAGWGTAGISWIKGIEAQFSNVAGLAYLGKTEVMFTNTNWLGSAGIGLNAFGLGQRIGETSVIGIGIATMNYGDLPITTTELPEGGIGTFKPQATNFNISFAKEFTNSISGGINVKVISQAIPNLRAQGIAFDAGIRYTTGEQEQIKFGISLKNVGPPMKFSGDGLAISTQNSFTGLTSNTEQRVSKFELPSLVHIGASYDFNFAEIHKLTLAGTFTSNSFTKDQWRAGLQYMMTANKAHFYLRGGFVFEREIFDAAIRTSALTGPTAGLSVELPFGENASTIGIDYAYRSADPFGAIHSIGARINVK